MEVIIVFVLFIILWLLFDIRKSVILQFNQQSEFNHPLHSSVDMLMQNQEVDSLKAEQKRAYTELGAFVKTHQEETKVEKNINHSPAYLSFMKSCLDKNNKLDWATRIKNQMIENNYAIINGRKTMVQASEEYEKILNDQYDQDDTYEKWLADK